VHRMRADATGWPEPTAVGGWPKVQAFLGSAWCKRRGRLGAHHPVSGTVLVQGSILPRKSRRISMRQTYSTRQHNKVMEKSHGWGN